MLKKKAETPRQPQALNINEEEALKLAKEMNISKETALTVVLAKKASIEANKKADLAVEKADKFFTEAIKSANAAAEAANAKLLSIQKQRLSQPPQKSLPLKRPDDVQEVSR
jgi:hypothetical protein